MDDDLKIYEYLQNMKKKYKIIYRIILLFIKLIHNCQFIVNKHLINNSILNESNT
jgi:hypothetical protein